MNHRKEESLISSATHSGGTLSKRSGPTSTGQVGGSATVHTRVARTALALLGITTALALAGSSTAYAGETTCDQRTQKESTDIPWFPYDSPDGPNGVVTKAAKSAYQQFVDGDAYEFGTCGALRYAGGKQHYDCSGLDWWAYHNAGKEFERQTAHYYYTTGSNWPEHKVGRRVGLWERRTGDLLFWDANHDDVIEHMGMYLGPNRTAGMNGKEEIVEALNLQTGIRVTGYADRQAGLMPSAVRVVG